jgi:hypothetical protein
MQGARATEESPPAKKAVKNVVLVVPMKAVEEAADVEVDVNSTDIAQLSEGKINPCQLNTGPGLLIPSQRIREAGCTRLGRQ